MGALTASAPKCLLPLEGKPLLDYQLDAFEACRVEDVAIVTGHCGEKIPEGRLRKIPNPFFAEMNMVGSLFNSDELSRVDSDVIISYGDIVFSSRVIDLLLKETESLSVVVDHDWLRIWSARMEDPLEDAETLTMDKDGFITDLGKIPKTIEEIEGQYVGLLKISREALADVVAVWESLDRNAIYDGQTFNNMYMTSYLRELIHRNLKLKAVSISGGWFEFDSPSDFVAFAHLKAEQGFQL